MQSTLLAIVLVPIAALASCASTTLDNTWKDPQYRGGPVSKILVVGISTKTSVRRDFEETFAQALTEKGVPAVASYTLIPQDGQIPEEELKKATEQSGANAVLITRLVSRDKEVFYSPASAPPASLGLRQGYHGYYTGAWAGHYEPMTMVTTDLVITETTLFRTDAPEPVWSATSRTLEPHDIRYATRGFAKAMIAALRKQGMI